MSYYLNGSGCKDPTAGAALANYDPEKEKMRHLVRRIKQICEAEGFEIQGRITLKSDRTGRIFR